MIDTWIRIWFAVFYISLIGTYFAVIIDSAKGYTKAGEIIVPSFVIVLIVSSVMILLGGLSSVFHWSL